MYSVFLSGSRRRRGSGSASDQDDEEEASDDDYREAKRRRKNPIRDRVADFFLDEAGGWALWNII